MSEMIVALTKPTVSKLRTVMVMKAMNNPVIVSEGMDVDKLVSELCDVYIKVNCND